jgi:hypothetical protein
LGKKILKKENMAKNSRCPVIKEGVAGTLHANLRRMETPSC